MDLIYNFNLLIKEAVMIAGVLTETGNSVCREGDVGEKLFNDFENKFTKNNISKNSIAACMEDYVRTTSWGKDGWAASVYQRIGDNSANYTKTYSKRVTIGGNYFNVQVLREFSKNWFGEGYTTSINLYDAKGKLLVSAYPDSSRLMGEIEDWSALKTLKSALKMIEGEDMPIYVYLGFPLSLETKEVSEFK